MGVKSSVPILEHEGQFIQGSTEIIDYLDSTFPEKILTPKDPTLKKKALYSESHLANEIGVPVRLCIYHIPLDYPKIVKPFFAHNGPWYSHLFLTFAYSKIASKIRCFMKINS